MVAGAASGGVRALVLGGVKRNGIYVITHPERRAGVEARFTALLAAFDGPDFAAPPFSRCDAPAIW